MGARGEEWVSQRHSVAANITDGVLGSALWHQHKASLALIAVGQVVLCPEQRMVWVSVIGCGGDLFFVTCGGV